MQTSEQTPVGTDEGRSDAHFPSVVASNASKPERSAGSRTMAQEDV
jgi:hypothetical protein